MSALVVISLSAWNLGVTYTRIALDGFIAPEKGLQALQAARGLEVPFGWILLGNLAFYGYLIFLRFLPTLIAERADSKQQKAPQTGSGKEP